MNIPNRLTILRMFLAPVFLSVFLARGLPHRFLWGLIVFGLAALTDFADGKIARKTNQITVFGKLADPVADKMLTTAALLAFMSLGLCNIWIVMIILTREFAVTSIRLVASAQGVVIPANIWGKLKTASQMIFTLVIMLLGGLRSSGHLPGAFNLPLLSNALLWMTAVLAVLSGMIYLYDSRDLVNFKN